MQATASSGASHRHPPPSRDCGVHRGDDSIWFTDPSYGVMRNDTGHKAAVELPESAYRIDSASGALTKVTDDINRPNGLCFPRDLTQLYVSDTAAGAHATGVWDVAGKRLTRGRQFASMKMDGFGKAGHSDGIRSDMDGNTCSSAGWVATGYDGVHVFAPNGDRIGQILLPEVCANLCFGGSKRNRLFMAASQSLYAVYTNAAGAHMT